MMFTCIWSPLNEKFHQVFRSRFNYFAILIFWLFRNERPESSGDVVFRSSVYMQVCPAFIEMQSLKIGCRYSYQTWSGSFFSDSPWWVSLTFGIRILPIWEAGLEFLSSCGRSIWWMVVTFIKQKMRKVTSNEHYIHPLMIMAYR